MDKVRRRFFLEWITFSCSLIVVFISASTMRGKVDTPQLIGLIAGSFGAGAAMANSIRDYAAARKGRGRQSMQEGMSCTESDQSPRS